LSGPFPKNLTLVPQNLTPPVYPTPQLWTSYSPPRELEISRTIFFSNFELVALKCRFEDGSLLEYCYVCSRLNTPTYQGYCYSLDDEDTMHHWNVGLLLLEYKSQNPRRLSAAVRTWNLAYRLWSVWWLQKFCKKIMHSSYTLRTDLARFSETLVTTFKTAGVTAQKTAIEYATSCLLYRRSTELRGRLVKSPTSYLGGPGFRPSPEDRLY
jgi:hypothetical protein